MNFNDNDDIGSPAAEEWLDRMIIVHKQIHEILKKINDRRSKMHMEKSRQFVLRDMVCVDRRNLQIKGNRSLAISVYGITGNIERSNYRQNVICVK